MSGFPVILFLLKPGSPAAGTGSPSFNAFCLSSFKGPGPVPTDLVLSSFLSGAAFEMLIGRVI